MNAVWQGISYPIFPEILPLHTPRRQDLPRRISFSGLHISFFCLYAEQILPSSVSDELYITAALFSDILRLSLRSTLSDYRVFPKFFLCILRVVKIYRAVYLFQVCTYLF